MADSKKRNRDLLTLGYNISGKMFRDSIIGKANKFSITNQATKAVRDLAINKAPEHVKRFAQYLTGGTRGDVTKLSPEIIADIASAKKRADEATALGYDQGDMIDTYPGIKGKLGSKEYFANVKAYTADKKAGVSEKELHKRYYTGEKARTWGSIGTAQLKMNPDGKSSQLTDRYDVDHDPDYKPLRGLHYDLQEGGAIASRAYDLAKWLGITGDYDYNVRIPTNAMKIKKKENG